MDMVFSAAPPAPSVYLFIKNLEKREDLEQQLFELNGKKACTVGVLTDGVHWKLYYLHPGEQYSNECLAAFDMLETNAGEIADLFEKFMSRGANASGSVLGAAKSLLWPRHRRKSGPRRTARSPRHRERTTLPAAARGGRPASCPDGYQSRRERGYRHSQQRGESPAG